VRADHLSLVQPDNTLCHRIIVGIAFRANRWLKSG
jgi:hypothetical protein